MAALRRLADALDEATSRRRRPRSVLEIAAADLLTQLRAKRGRRGGRGYDGREFSRLAEPAFWAMLLLAQRRERFAMHLISQEHKDAAAVRPYVREKQATQEILDAIPGIDPDSLIGFVDIAVDQFRPAGVSGATLVPAGPGRQILKAALLRGAIVGELRPDAVQEAWLESHPEARAQPTRAWKLAQGRAETLYRAWSKQRGAKRRLI